MKYLKKSFLMLICAIILNVGFASAYTTSAVTFSAEVSRVTTGKSINKTKNTYSFQRFKVHEETENTCQGCTYTAYPVGVNDGTHYRGRGKIAIGETVSMQSDSYDPGDYYVEIYRDDVMLVAFKKLGLFAYDPNALYY